ncbi:MAG TPA: TonB-dependent receptor [Blastocatellia bacterium]|nr:TonB-dependent receptor [Blastocatellia bacterium]
MNRSTHIKSTLFAGLLLFLFPLTGRAQVTDATLKLNVTDAQNGAVMNATAEIVNEETNVKRLAATDNNGQATVAGLASGQYTVLIKAGGFKTNSQRSLRLNVGQTTELKVQLTVGEVQEIVNIEATAAQLQVATEGRVADTLDQKKISELPIPQRDVFALPKLSAAATIIPGAANSTKLTSSPIITVNGNRYRGNNYVLDGAMNSNSNNSGEPAIVPSLETIEEVQVQTSNFSSEFGRGNGAVINLRTKSGTNQFHGSLWEFHRNAALNNRNHFASGNPPLVFNQFGGKLGGPILKDRTFFFGNYEGTRNAGGRSASFLVETPQLRDYVARTAPNSIANQLLTKYAAPAPQNPVSCASRVASNNCLNDGGTFIPTNGTLFTTIDDYVRYNQMMGKIDHSFNDGKDKIYGRYIFENQADQTGATSGAVSQSGLGRVMRGMRGAYEGRFSNTNLGYTKVFKRAVNDLRFAFQTIYTNRGNDDAEIPQITVTGWTAGWGDFFNSATKIRTYEWRDVLTLDRGRHALRIGGEYRRLFKGLSIAPPDTGTYTFNNIASFLADRPFRQTLTVNPDTGERANFPRYFVQFETGFFFQDDWRVNSRLNLNLGLRHDYFGTVKEREGRLSSIVFGAGNTFRERLANASLVRVEQLYHPEKTNFSPRIGLAYDPFGDGKSSIRAGFSLAYQPHHGQSISGARPLPPDVLQGVVQPDNGIGTRILYGIPVPFNSDFARGFNPRGGVNTPPGQAAIRPTGFVVNPTIKTQYSESWFLNLQREVWRGWIVEAGYTGTKGVNLERIDDVNRFAGDLLDGREDRINPNFSTLLFVTNGVDSIYHAMTLEVRRNLSKRFSFQANYRWSKWLDTSSDTSTGQFADNSEPGKGAVNIDCLRCERGPSLFDIPHRFSAQILWTPKIEAGNRWLTRFTNGWEMAAIFTRQAGRPFSVWNGAASTTTGTPGDYNRDGGGGAVGGGFYDRPNAPAPGTIKTTFDQQDFLNGLFPVGAFPAPQPGQSGTLGRNTFRGPKYSTVDLSLARSVTIREGKQLQFRFEAFNALNQLNLYLPNSDLSLSNTFGKSTQAFEARTLQISVRFTF